MLGIPDSVGRDHFKSGFVIEIPCSCTQYGLHGISRWSEWLYCLNDEGDTDVSRSWIGTYYSRIENCEAEGERQRYQTCFA
jgi:hypothetical protein